MGNTFRDDHKEINQRNWTVKRAMHIAPPPPHHQPTYLPTYQPTYPPTYLPTYQPTYLTTHLPSYLTTHLSTLSLEAPTTKLHHKAHLDTCCCYRIESLGLVLDRNSSFRHALELDCYSFSISSYLRHHRFVNTD